MRTLMLGVCLTLTAGATIVAAQQPAAPATAVFEVASLKQNNSGERGGSIRRLPGGRVAVTNMAARQLVSFAFGLQAYQLIGGPNWLNDDKFDLTAKMEGNPEWGGPGTGQDPMTLALRKLLVERFKLKVHSESRDLDAYALVVVKPGVTGPQLKPSTTDCKALAEQARQGKLPPLGPNPATGPVPCSILGNIGGIRFDGFPMSQAAGMFFNQSGRPVVDRTGLTGTWQFELTFAQERRIGPEGQGETLPPPDPNLPNFFTALQEQLGLKLESTKAPFDVTVIDSVDHPIDD